MFSMECQFCHTEFNEAEGSCPCCGLKVDYLIRKKELDNFWETKTKKDFEKKKRELRKQKYDNFELLYFYCKKNVVLGRLSELPLLLTVDYDCLMVLVRYNWYNIGYTNVRCDVVGFYDKDNNDVRRVRLTDKLYIEGSHECIGATSNSWFHSNAFHLSSVATFEHVGDARCFPYSLEGWDLTKLDETIGV